MRICFISGDFFAWGKYGGFGRVTRLLGRELARRGHEVSAVVPRRGTQRRIETVDGVRVYGFPMYFPPVAFGFLKACDADVYHSQEPGLATWLAMRARPDRMHIITCRDTRGPADWRVEISYASLSRLQGWLTRLYEDGPWARAAVKRADRLFCASETVGRRAMRHYGLVCEPGLLPSPIPVPDGVAKAVEPTVCYVGRLDPRKRPERFFALAEEFPAVRFAAVGSARDRRRDTALREEAARIPNLTVWPFINQFESPEIANILDRSWILVNTSLREGLPNSFLEAAAHRCAILSTVDPDGFASNFGCRVEDDNYASGLRFLLEHDRWMARGEAGFHFVRKGFEQDRVVDLHEEIYRGLTKKCHSHD